MFKTIILVSFYLFISLPLTLYANSWDDLQTSDPDPDPIPIYPCKSLIKGLTKPCLQLIEESMSISKVTKTSNNKVLTKATIINELVNDKNTDVQLAALKMLGSKPSMAKFESIKGVLNSPNAEIKRMSLYVINKMSCKECLNSMVGILNNINESAELRIQAASYLREAKHEHAIPYLQVALSDLNYGVMLEAAISLAEYNDKSVIDILYDAAIKEELNESARVDAILALEKLSGIKFGYSKKYNAFVSQQEKMQAIERLKKWKSTLVGAKGKGGLNYEK